MKVRKPLEPKTEVEDVENPYSKMTDAELIALYHRSVESKETDVTNAGMAAAELIDIRGYKIVEHDFKRDEFVKKVA
jgi:hypothetical protein